jgi:hypothetical protein
MPEKAPRFVPITWGIIDLLVAAAIVFFWRPASGTLLWYVRGVPVVILGAMGLQSMWIGFFASAEVVRRRAMGDFTDDHST